MGRQGRWASRSHRQTKQLLVRGGAGRAHECRLHRPGRLGLRFTKECLEHARLPGMRRGVPAEAPRAIRGRLGSEPRPRAAPRPCGARQQRPNRSRRRRDGLRSGADFGRAWRISSGPQFPLVLSRISITGSMLPFSDNSKTATTPYSSGATTPFVWRRWRLRRGSDPRSLVSTSGDQLVPKSQNWHPLAKLSLCWCLSLSLSQPVGSPVQPGIVIEPLIGPGIPACLS